MSTLQILYHGNCFDGVTSSAIFYRFYRECVSTDIDVVFRGMQHRLGDPFGADHEVTFYADQNAVLDFRYSPSPRLNWWCDHHPSAFLTPDDKRYFEAHASPQHCFDPQAPSCAGLLARFLATNHGFDSKALAEHVHWADLIDAARFESAEQAVKLEHPALQLMMVLEAGASAALAELMIRGLSECSLEAVRQLPEVSAAWDPVWATHQRHIALLRDAIEVSEDVLTFDLSGELCDGLNKFIPYYLDPSIHYVVGLTRSAKRTKISVNSNPWRRPNPAHNIAHICERYGGGGHAVVGAVSLPPDQRDKGLHILKEIADTLRQGL